MKKCLRCGNDNPDEMRFCLNCGNAMTQIASSSTNFGEQNSFTVQNAPPPKSNRKWLIAGVSAAVVALLLLGVGFVGLLLLFSGGNSTVRTANTNVATTIANARNRNQNVNAAKTNVNSAIANSASSPGATTSANSGEATKQATFTVSANDEWQLSDIKVVPLEMFQTSVSGTINLADIKNGVSAKGVTDAKAKSRRIYPEFPTGALLMRTQLDAGGYSNISAVWAEGQSGIWQNAKDERGKLEFIVNDNAQASNTGEFTVQVLLLSAPE